MTLVNLAFQHDVLLGLGDSPAGAVGFLCLDKLSVIFACVGMSGLALYQSAECLPVHREELSVGFNVGGILLAGWNHALGGFGIFDHLCLHSSSISCLCSFDMYACVL